VDGIRDRNVTGVQTCASDLEDLTMDEEHLLDVLREMHHGRQNVVSSRNLRHFGWEGSYIRELVHKLRVKGYPICSCNDGYYYGSDRDEVKQTINSIGSRIKKMMDV